MWYHFFCSILSFHNYLEESTIWWSLGIIDFYNIRAGRNSMACGATVQRHLNTINQVLVCSGIKLERPSKEQNALQLVQAIFKNNSQLSGFPRSPAGLKKPLEAAAPPGPPHTPPGILPFHTATGRGRYHLIKHTANIKGSCHLIWRYHRARFSIILKNKNRKQ